MNNEIPFDHPRRLSLLLREKIVSGWKDGLVAQVGLIAHGRGEAFDYLIGEKTSTSSLIAIKYAALLLLTAKKPVISVNGNTAVLVKDDLIKLASLLSEKRGDIVPIEVNIFYRTPERMRKLIKYMKTPLDSKVKILGANADARIPGLSSERAKCDKDGIFSADVIFVPLEDGDRCEALKKMGKTVIAIDLNPFSRTSRTASVTIVDNIIRIIPELIKEIMNINEKKSNIQKIILETHFSNKTNLQKAVEEIKNFINEFSIDPVI